MSAIRSRVTAAIVTIVALTGVSLIAAPAAEAATLTVSNPGGGGMYTSIQDAINAAQNGDTVSVAAGTYDGQLYLSKYIALVGAGRGSSIIQSPGGSVSTMFIQNVPYVAGGKTTVQGFTIQGGNAPSGQGGGITISPNADPWIIDNTIQNNHAQGYGGGISIHGNASPLIRNNIFQGNTATLGGGAIFAYDNSSPIIYGNQITSNSSTGGVITNGGSSGGGVYLENTPGSLSYPVVMNNTITGNIADFAGGGIMLRTGVAAMIYGNTIDSNRAAYGAGIHVETTGSSVTIQSNLIRNNVAQAGDQYSGDGGGISAYDSSVVMVRDNTITGNRASNAGGGVVIAENANVTLQGNTINNNGVGPNYTPGTPSSGGGVYVANASLAAYNNVVTGNSANRGGGFAMLDGSRSIIDSNTIASNSETDAPGGAVLYTGNASGGGDLSNNIIFANTFSQVVEQGVTPQATKRNNLIDQSTVGNAAYTGPSVSYSTAQALNTSGRYALNNFSGDPQFTNASAGDYTLKSTSPAIDKSATSLVAILPGDDRRDAIRNSGPPDVGAYEYLANPVIKSHVYRFWSPINRGHFYTISPSERDGVASSYNPKEWRFEQIAYDAFLSQLPGTVPLYRSFSTALNAHFYTINPDEYAAANSRADHLWSGEGIAYYVYPLSYTGISFTVYRFWSPDNKHHFYTASAGERDSVIASFPSNVWTYEGPQFRVP